MILKSLTKTGLAALMLSIVFAASVPARANTLAQQWAASSGSGSIDGAAVPQSQMDKMRLSDRDIATYRKIFTAQRRNDQATVKALGKKLDDPSLMDWAHMKKNIPGSLWLPQTVAERPREYRSVLPRTDKQQEAADNIALSVALLIRTDDTDRAMGVVSRASARGTIDRIEGAQLWAMLAGAYLYENDPRRALALSHKALQIGGLVVPQAAWIAGLSSWKLGEYQRAGLYFAWVPKSPYADPWLRSASAYWVARTMMRTGHYNDVSTWLREAAKQPRSFYGLIATRALGARFDFNWSVPPFSVSHLKTLARYPGAVRALKLAQVGQLDMARLELALLDAKAAKQWREALASLAVAALKPDAAISVASLLEHPSGGKVDTALYPIAPWQPKDGYRLDPALINAFIRQESRFKPAAVNKESGAAGLLQLMPRTARAVDHKTDKSQLTNPETSMMLGQKYLEELLERTEGNLFEAAIAYNAGPGNLASWKQRFADVSDPLLFVELVPFAETRGYVQRVMANYWIYSLRMGSGAARGVASLDNVAAGQHAQYIPATNRGTTAIVLGELK